MLIDFDCFTTNTLLYFCQIVTYFILISNKKKILVYWELPVAKLQTAENY